MPADPNRELFPANVLRRFPRLAACYFSADPRSLGLARIGLACLLLYDLLRRIPGLETWYTNNGLLPNHTTLWRPSAQWMFSFFFAASWANEVRFLFALCGLVYLAFLFGWRTRLAHALSLMCVVSLHSRVIFLENGGDVALNILCAWTLFLPMGARFSIDALTKSWRARHETSVAELNQRAALAPDNRPVRSLVFLAVLLQLAVIYYFNCVSKTGATWHNGTAVHYVLQQERMVSWLGWKLRGYLTLPLSRFATYYTLGCEGLAPLLILSPFFRVYTRRLAVILVPALHLSFALLLNVGMFSFNMMGYFPLLLSEADWAIFARRLGPAPERARLVYVDETSPLSFGWARLLARLDTFARLTFLNGSAPSDDALNGAAPSDDALPAEGGELAREISQGGSAGDVRPRFATERAPGVARAIGYDALITCIAALPCGWAVAMVLGAPGIRALGRWLYARVAAKQSRIDGWLASRAAPNPAPPRATGPSWWARRRAELRESLVLVMMVALGSQVLMENKVVPAFLKLGQMEWMKQLVMYPRLFQGWSMFTPDPPTGERMVYVDAVTIDGRHIDPYNLAGSRVAELPVTRIPAWMDQDEFWCDYTNRIPENGAYHGPLKEWISSYHKRTGRAEDRVLSFEVFLIESDSAPPGQYGPRNIRTRSMLKDKP
jgi:hypothetical protein